MDLEPFLDAPFESASNVSFELLLLAGAALLALVSIVGRGPITAAIVAVYLLAVPGYVAFRIRAWDGPDEDETEGDEPGTEGTSDTDGNGRSDVNAGDRIESDGDDRSDTDGTD